MLSPYDFFNTFIGTLFHFNSVMPNSVNNHDGNKQ